jgi:hypothetical protein
MKSSLRSLVVVLALLATSCASSGGTRETASNQTPQEYLDWLSEQLSSVLTYMTAWSDEFDVAVETDDYARMKPVRVELRNKVGAITDTMRKQPPAGTHGKELRAAYVEFLEASHPFVDLLAKVETFDANVADAQVQAFVAELEGALAGQSQRQAALLEALAKFADANGISLE